MNQMQAIAPAAPADAAPAHAARGPSGRSGVLWSALNGLAGVVVPFVVFAAFARLMTPAQFARFAVALAALELLKALGPMGLYDILVTREESDTTAHRGANSWLLGGAALLALAYAGCLALADPLLGMVMPWPTYLLCGKLLLDYALMQPQAMLVRRKEVRRLGSRSLIAGLAGGVGGFAVGLVATPELGLALFYLLQAAVSFGATVWRTDSWRWPALRASDARPMMAQGIRASGVRLAGAANSYLDQLVVGRVFAPALVGDYNLGKRLEVVSITIAGSCAQILWQRAFATGDLADRRRALAPGIASAALLCGVPVAGFTVLHAQAVGLIFGRQWQSAALVAALLALSGGMRALGSVAGAMLTVTGRNGRMLALSLFAASSNLAVILALAPFGLEATAYGVLLRNMGQCLLQFAALGEMRRHAMGLLWSHFAVPVGVSALACALAAWAAQGALLAWAMPDTLRGLLVLAAGGLAGGLVGLRLLWRRMG
ncbi:MAG TPA: oligosaccharide flippase family protein [Novosphingobium sp.]|nr:oligosaccharide flippase family protein [Novosphingobium sp.]